MINVFKNQIIVEGCSLNENFKLIAKWDYLFNDYVLDIKYSEKNIRKKIFSFLEIYNSDILPEDQKYIFIKIYVKLCNKENK